MTAPNPQPPPAEEPEVDEGWERLKRERQLPERVARRGSASRRPS